jgi:ATP-dependent Clp protease protease subunit
MSKWFSVRNAAKADEPVEILIYDQIGKDWFDDSGVNAKDFAEELKGIPAGRKITVRINSPGGNVWDGLAIYHQLKSRRQDVTVLVDGLAASIASVIALAGSELRIPKNALYMIHDPSGLVVGTAEDMQKMAAELDKHADVLAGIYAEKTGKTRTEMRSLMRAETWFTGEEAVKARFADTATDEVSLTASFNLSGFRRVPAAIGGKPSSPTPPPHKQMDTNAPTATAEPQNALPPKPSQLQPAPVAAADPRILSLEAALKADKDKRITAELNRLAEANPTIVVAEWKDRVLADETLLASLAKLPAPMAGIEPVRPIITGGGQPLIEAYRGMQPGAARRDFRVQNFADLRREHQRISPQAANTLAAALIPDFLADGIIVQAQNKLAMLNAFTRDFGVDPLRPRATVQVTKATAGATGQQNASSFESGDTTLAAAAVTVNHESVSFHLTTNQLNQGFRLAQLAEINAEVMANQISDRVTAVILVGTYGAGTVIGAAANFDSADLPPIWALAKNYRRKHLILDGGHLAYLLPVDKEKFRLGEEGAYNFDLIAENNRWTGATANTAGFICGPDAIAVASGLPIEDSMPAGEFISKGSVQLKNGLTIGTCVWYSRASRTVWASYDVMFGAVAGDATQAEVLLTA